MRAKQVAASLLPPALAGAWRQGSPFSRVWDGVYSDFRDVPRSGPGFDADEWIRQSKAAYRSLISPGSEASQGLPTDYHSLLFLLAAVTHPASGPLRILDFGGNLGLSYLRLRGGLASNLALAYHVIETERMCRAGRELFSGNDEIQFSSELPALPCNLDIIYLSSSLQYVEDYQTILSQLAGYNAGCLLFTKLSAGEFDTYATAQLNHPDSVIPYWFINLAEIIGILKSKDYDLVFESTNTDEWLPQPNFPKQIRLAHTCNLLFRRQLRDTAGTRDGC